MKTWMKWVLYPAGSLVVLVAAAFAYGMTRPEEIKIALSMDIAAPPEKVFPLMADPREVQKWYPAIEKVEILQEKPFRYRVLMDGQWGTMEAVEVDAPRRLVTKSVGETMGISGVWDFTVSPLVTAQGTGSKVQEIVTFRIGNPMMRTMVSMMDGTAEERKTMRMMKAYAEKN